MSKQDEPMEEKVEKQEEARVEVRIEGASPNVPLERKEEITIEEPQETHELRVEVPSEYQLSSDEMTKIAKESANKLLDTMKGNRAAVRSIVARIQRIIRVSNIQRITRISEITEIWRG